eukprot:575103-Pleurochrysis_carterae.AAC.1
MVFEPIHEPGWNECGQWDIKLPPASPRQVCALSPRAEVRTGSIAKTLERLLSSWSDASFAVPAGLQRMRQNLGCDNVPGTAMNKAQRSLGFLVILYMFSA